MEIFKILEISVGLLMIILGFMAIGSKKLINSIIYLSIMSMLAVVSFVIMRAPDVAITEAVIGSGLVTAIFVFTLFFTEKAGEK